jgi:uncharacterized membrane protein YcaP (DUF421 family)
VPADPDVAEDRYIQLSGRGWHVWLRRALIALITVLLVAAVLNLFGQLPTTATATTPQATMSEPVVLIERGNVQQIGSLDQVEWAVLETTGRISFLSKS